MPHRPKVVPLFTTIPGGTVILGSATNLVDSATLSGRGSPGGTITFTLVAPNGSTVDTETVTVSGNGAYYTPTGYLPTSAGTYYAVNLHLTGDRKSCFLRSRQSEVLKTQE